MKVIRLLCLFASITLAFGATAFATDSLEAGVRHPPDSVKPQTWWHRMNGNITKVGITADLDKGEIEAK
jgi:hypothetical protein